MNKAIRYILSAAVVVASFLCGCARNSDGGEGSGENSEFGGQTENMEECVITVTVNGVNFTAETAGNEASEVFCSMLPLELEMLELNANEKYCYLNANLPASPSNPEVINCGDIMLFGTSCVVIFYRTFSTPYAYTRLGKITECGNLGDVLGSGSVRVVFGK